MCKVDEIRSCHLLHTATVPFYPKRDSRRAQDFSFVIRGGSRLFAGSMKRRLDDAADRSCRMGPTPVRLLLDPEIAKLWGLIHAADH